MSKERISGAAFDFFLDGTPIHAENITLSITDNTAVAMTGAVPDGYVAGDVAAEGDIELDERNFSKIEAMARRAGSYRDIPTTDFVFFVSRGGTRKKVEVFGAKLLVTDLLNIDPKGGSKSTNKIKYFVTSKDFVKINGIPYLSATDTRYM